MDKALLSRLYDKHVATLTEAYAKALASAGFDAAVLHSGSLVRKTRFDDQDWPLRVVPHFAHWLPLAEPDCALVVAQSGPPRLIHPHTTSFWEAPPAPESDHFWPSFQLVRPASVEAVRSELPSGRVAFVGDDERRAAGWDFAPEAVNPPALIVAFDAIRTRKTAYEVECIAEANRRASRGHDALREAFASGETAELALHLLFLKATAQDDPETPYKNIVAGGRHAATLHHVSYRKDASGAPSLLVDAGAVCLGYCSDITRTWVKGDGAGASAFASLVAAVEAMQKRLVERIAIGLLYEELHDESHRQVSAILHELGVARMSPEAIDHEGISRAFYPHGLGHSLGLQTHDVGCATTRPRADNPFLRNTARIETGQVFTMEPGVYFIEELLARLKAGPHAGDIDWDVVGALAPFGGVRVEDDILVRAEGEPVRNFTREVLPWGGGLVR